MYNIYIILGEDISDVVSRYYDEYGDDLLVENPKSKNKYPHITISRGEGAPHLYSQILFNKTNQENHMEYFDDEKRSNILKGEPREIYSLLANSIRMTLSGAAGIVAGAGGAASESGRGRRSDAG